MHLYIIDVVYRSGSRICSARFAYLTFLPVHFKHFSAKALPVRTIVKRMEIICFNAVLDELQLLVCHLINLLAKKKSTRPASALLSFFILLFDERCHHLSKLCRLAGSCLFTGCCKLLHNLALQLVRFTYKASFLFVFFVAMVCGLGLPIGMLFIPPFAVKCNSELYNSQSNEKCS